MGESSAFLRPRGMREDWSAARQVHDAAEQAGLPCRLGTMPELGVASEQGLHLGTLPNFTFPSDGGASARW